MKKNPQIIITSARGRNLNLDHLIFFTQSIISYDSIPSSPSLTSGNQWQKQLAKRTPPPRLRRKDRVTFFGFFFCFFINSGCDESILEKSYLGKIEGLNLVILNGKLCHFFARSKGRKPVKRLSETMRNVARSFSPTKYMMFSLSGSMSRISTQIINM